MFHSQCSAHVRAAAIRAAVVSSVLGVLVFAVADARGGGCADSGECPPGFFCQTLTGQCGSTGTCVAIPEVCPLIFNPVCGCDGVTYTNSCFAAAAGVSIAHFGDCGKISPCADSGACPAGFFCQKAVGDCDGIGTCAPMPQFCPLVFDPVCGCDGQTYSNSCFAAAAGVSIAHVGPCAPAPDADLNDDGVVNSLDLGILLAAWSIPPGTPACGGAVPCPADINGDGFVNSLDLGILLSSWTL